MICRVSKYVPVWLFTLLAIVVPALSQSSDFSVIVLPDTQHYSEKFPEIFNKQTEWIVENLESRNIKFVIGVGDIVEHPENIAEWQNADAAIRMLDGKVPYVMAIGNHDYKDQKPSSRSAENFNAYFGPSRYSGYSWYGASNYPTGSNENFYATVTVGTTKFLILALEFMPRDAALAWASDVLDSHPDTEVIITTHSYMWTDNTRADQCDQNDLNRDNDGQEMWDNFVKQHANTIMVVNGHFIRDTGGSRRRDLGVNWNLVNQMFSNYQDFKNGGNGYLRILKFRPSLNVIEVSTYSPWLDASLTDDDNQFTVPYHRPATSGTTGTIKGRTRGRRLNGFYDCKSISDANVSDGTDSATTDSTGRFDFTLTHGTYTLTASKSAWVTTSKGIGVYAGYTTDAPMFLKPVVGKVTGKVTDSSGAAISGANLNFSGGKLTPTKALNFLTDSSGNYTTASLSVGSYEVTISKTGYVTETRTKTVTADTTGTLNVTLQKQ